MVTPQGNVAYDNIVCNAGLHEREQNGASLWPGTLEKHSFIEVPLKGMGKAVRRHFAKRLTMPGHVGNKKKR